MWLDKTIYNNTTAPKRYDRFISTFNDNNPDFKVEFWNMEKVTNLFKDYPVIQKYYKMWINLPHHIQKCDVARYFIMYLFGGIYIDMDFNCYKNLTPLLDRELLLLMEPPEHSEIFEKGKKLYNGFIGSVPYHPFWLDWLDYVAQSVKKSKDVMETTGPLNFARFWMQSDYTHIPLVDTCDILPLYYCHKKPHCMSRLCKKRIKKHDWNSTNYYQKMGNYADTKWIEGSQWGVEQLNEQDFVEGMSNLSTNGNVANFSMIIFIVISIIIIILIVAFFILRKN